MTESSNHEAPAERTYLVSPKALRNLFIWSWVVAALILIVILTLTSSRPRSSYDPADESQYQTTVQEAARLLEEPGVNELGAGRIPIERAMTIVAEKGLTQVGTELTTAAAPPEVEAAAPIGNNPYAGNQAAIAEGEALVMGSLACGSCHGPNLAGGIGPSLTDNEWIYGGEDADIFETLTSGRPGGMPSFAAQTDEDARWKVVSYIKSLSPGQ